MLLDSNHTGETPVPLRSVPSVAWALAHVGEKPEIIQSLV